VAGIKVEGHHRGSNPTPVIPEFIIFQFNLGIIQPTRAQPKRIGNNNRLRAPAPIDLVRDHKPVGDSKQGNRVVLQLFII
jgi:hypothetical protein